MALLDHLPEYADKLDKKSVTDKIWPNLVGVSYILFELTFDIDNLFVLIANRIFGYSCCDSGGDRQVYYLALSKCTHSV